jgi:hypothetical protein
MKASDTSTLIKKYLEASTIRKLNAIGVVE